MKTTFILFRTEMVQAILSGRKTMTRRLLVEKQNCRYGKPGEILWVR
jgi:uncharacterized protein YqfB (UPF0267 family)